VLRKAEEDRKQAAAKLKAEKLEAKRLAKAEQEQRLLAERKLKDSAKELGKQQTKQQKFTLSKKKLPSQQRLHKWRQHN
jgi:hypothetical protein